MSECCDLEKLFKEYAGSDGLLSKRELMRMIRKKMKEDDEKGNKPERPGREERQRMFKEWDEDGDGKLSFEEFKSAVEKLKVLQ